MPHLRSGFCLMIIAVAYRYRLSNWLVEEIGYGWLGSKWHCRYVNLTSRELTSWDLLMFEWSVLLTWVIWQYLYPLGVWDKSRGTGVLIAVLTRSLLVHLLQRNSKTVTVDTSAGELVAKLYWRQTLNERNPVYSCASWLMPGVRQVLDIVDAWK